MNDPRRPVGFDPTRQAAGPMEPAPVSYPPYVDPAYAGQLPTYGARYLPQHTQRTQNPTTPLSQQHWAPGQPPPGQPPGSLAAGDGSGPSQPPKPPGSPRWLFLLAGGAVLLVVGLVVALIVTNGTTKMPTAVSPLPSMPSTTPSPQVPATTTRLPSPTTSTEPPTTPTPTESTTAGEAQAVVYSVTGQSRAISIAYIETGGVLQTEFNVALPWSKQVSLTPPASKSASVTVVNIGEQVTCSVTVDGAQVRQRTGSIVTICAVPG